MVIIKYETFSKKKLQIKQINLEFNDGFKQFLKDEMAYGDNYIAKITSIIKMVGRYAKSRGIATSLQLDSLSANSGKVHKIFLSIDELETIKNTQLPNASLGTARDWLLISCFTGQRISDFLNLTKDNITEMKGHRLLSLKQQKGGKEILLPIFPEVEEVLKQRDGFFPKKLSDQNYNIQIKKVCQLAGISDMISGSLVNPETKRKEDGVYPKWMLVTSHIGRRSLATNLYGKYSTPLIMSMTGHTRENTFLQYIGKGQSHHALALAELLISK